MIPIIVRAKTSTAAMEEVVRQLGADALILSTTRSDDLIEITATTDDMFAGQSMDEDRGMAFSQMMEDRLTEARSRHRPRNADTPAGVVPTIKARHGGWPGLEEQFCRGLRSSLTDGADGFLSDLENKLLVPVDRSIRATTRIILVGPLGANKSQTALRLAEWLDSERKEASRDPMLMFCSSGSAADGAYLAAKAQVAGRKVHFTDPATLGETRASAEAPQVVVVSARRGDAAKAVKAIRRGGPAKVLLVLPTGLHPAAVDQYVGEWADVASAVILNNIDERNPGPEELSVLAHHGLPLGWIGTTESGGEGLMQPDIVHLKAWARGWLGALQGVAKPRILDPVDRAPEGRIDRSADARKMHAAAKSAPDLQKGGKPAVRIFSKPMVALKSNVETDEGPAAKAAAQPELKASGVRSFRLFGGAKKSNQAHEGDEA